MPASYNSNLCTCDASSRSTNHSANPFDDEGAGWFCSGLILMIFTLPFNISFYVGWDPEIYNVRDFFASLMLVIFCIAIVILIHTEPTQSRHNNSCPCFVIKEWTGSESIARFFLALFLMISITFFLWAIIQQSLQEASCTRQLSRFNDLITDFKKDVIDSKHRGTFENQGVDDIRVYLDLLGGKASVVSKAIDWEKIASTGANISADLGNMKEKKIIIAL